MRAAAAVAAILGLVAAVVGQPQPPLPLPPDAPVAPAAAPPGVKAPATAAPAAKAPELPPDPAVTAHVRNLGADDYRAREKAGRDLEALGDKALPHLKKALADTTNPEVARRLSVLVRKIDYERLVSPRRVTMPEKARTIKEAFDEVAKQTGYRIEFQGDFASNAARHKVAFNNVPFWQALDTIAELAGATVNNNGGDDDTIYVNNYGGGMRTPFVAYAGPYKIAANNIQLNRSMPLTAADPRGAMFVRPSESVNLMFNIYSEPKNPMLGMGLGPVVVTAEDELGQSMAPPPQGVNDRFGVRMSYYGGGSGNRSFQMSGGLNLVRGGREARTIRTLKAKVGVNLLSAAVPEVTFADPLKAKNVKAAGRTVEVELESVTAANGGYSAAMTIRRVGVQDPNNYDPFGWTNNIHQRVELIDAQGNRYRSNWPNMSNSNQSAVTMTVPFHTMDRRGMMQKLGPPVRLVVNEWVQATHEVTFEFRDVPLP
jgi:hypothetical protein